MEWIYLSPHFDDVALSCGGLVWEQSRAGEQVHIWTICGGEPLGGSLSPFAIFKHASWETDQDAVTQRRSEDGASCAVLGAHAHYFTILDCIYRQDPESGKSLYDSEESLWGPLHPVDAPLVGTLSDQLASELPAPVEIVCPLALGDHVDHHLTRAAAEALGRPLWYYADYPYIQRDAGELKALRQAGWKSVLMSVSDDGMGAWERSVAAHASQISTFWSSEPEMMTALQDYRSHAGGIYLWRAPPG